MSNERIVWTFEEYKERVAQMQSIGMSQEQIMLVLECVTISSKNPLFSISEE